MALDSEYKELKFVWNNLLKAFTEPKLMNDIRIYIYI